ncbi:hypothetical protein B566_EDAN004059 [Ephemera danica]|nr:hypothetical protein B566_EDAN004059 [Ephemera danica]
MHRARTVLNNLVPLAPMVPKVAPERFASWLSAANTKLVLATPPRRYYNAPVATEPFLNGSSSTYVEEMYNSWLADPKSVHAVSTHFARITPVSSVVKNMWNIENINPC